jgi:hypothetical protein
MAAKESTLETFVRTILLDLDEIARSHDSTEYGLPIFNEECYAEMAERLCELLERLDEVMRKERLDRARS